jgi:transcription antitermination factor NusG
MISWYALHIRSHFESYARLALEGVGLEVFLPMRTPGKDMMNSHNGLAGARRLSRPLFPNYLFCRFDAPSKASVLLTPGVNFVVGDARGPVSIAENEIHNIRSLIESGLAVTPFPYLETGEYVRVTRGQLKGATGFLTTLNHSLRLVTTVPLLRRSVSVELDPAWIDIEKPDVPLPHSPVNGTAARKLRAVSVRSAKSLSEPSSR